MHLVWSESIGAFDLAGNHVQHVRRRSLVDLQLGLGSALEALRLDGAFATTRSVSLASQSREYRFSRRRPFVVALKDPRASWLLLILRSFFFGEARS